MRPRRGYGFETWLFESYFLAPAASQSSPFQRGNSIYTVCYPSAGPQAIRAGAFAGGGTCTRCRACQVARRVYALAGRSLKVPVVAMRAPGRFGGCKSACQFFWERAASWVSLSLGSTRPAAVAGLARKIASTVSSQRPHLRERGKPSAALRSEPRPKPATAGATLYIIVHPSASPG